MTEKDWKAEYENVCKFANDYEAQRDALRAEVKQVHELLDTNGVCLAGEPLMARVSDLVAEWKEATWKYDQLCK